MSSRVVASCVATALITPPVIADEAVILNVQFLHPFLQPGQVQTIVVQAAFLPGLGGIAVWDTNGGQGQVGPVDRFANASFDLVNILNGDTGLFSGLTPNPLLNLGSQPGAPNGAGGVDGIRVGQWGFPAGPVVMNAIGLWWATWTPHTYEPRTVTFDTVAWAPPQIWLDVGFAFSVLDDWTPVHLQGSFQIVPAPPAALALGLAGVLVGRRRR